MDFNTSISQLQTRLHSLTGKINHSEASDSGLLKQNKAGSQTPKVMKPVFNILGKYSYERENILGVEISPHYIRLCQMKNSYGRWSLNQLASSCMESQFTNMDIQLNPDIYAENLKLLIEKHHIKTTDVALSVPTSASVIKIINMPEMEDEDLAQAAAMGAIWESMVQLNGSVQEYSVYYKVLRHKIKPSESLSIKDVYSPQASALDNLFAAGDDNILSAAAPEMIVNVPEVSLPEVKINNQSDIDLSNILQGEITPLVDIQNQAGENASEIQIESSNQDILTSIISEEVSTAPATETLEPAQIDVNPMEVEARIEESSAQVEPVPAEESNTMDVLFVATKMSDIQLYVGIVEKAGLNPVIVDVKCNALKHAFETNPEKHKIPEPYALLEFGVDENYIYIIEGQRVATFNITLSEDDRQLMIKHMDNPDALKSSIQRYADQLLQILENYTKQRKAANKVYNIYVSSSTPLHVDDASAEPLIHTFVDNLSAMMGGYKISSCSFCNHIEVPAEFAKKVNAEGNLSAWATVLGLATYKLDVFDCKEDDSAINRVNILPSAVALRKGRATQMLSTLAMAAVFAFIMVLSSASFAMLSAYGHTLVKEITNLAYVKGEYDNKNTELQKLSIVMDKVKSLDSVRTTLPSNQSQILDVYKNINKAIPEGVWLSDVSFNLPANMEIKGSSINDQNILEFVKKLNESGGFKKVSLKTMEVLESKDKTVATGSNSIVKKFALHGDLNTTVATQKLEIISGGVK